MAKAEVFTMRRRYVFPGTKGKVAFSLNPTADVTPVGVLPAMGPKYDEFCAKYARAESRERIAAVREED